MSANQNDLTQFRGRKLPIAYFQHVINSGLVLRQKVLPVGSEMQLVVMIAIGDSTNHLGWTGPTRVTYAGADIPSTDWHFHPGTRTTGVNDPLQGVDPWFPDAIPYNSTPILTVKLPVGEAETLQDVANLAVIYQCQKTEHRDITGAVTGNSTNGSLAQVASDYGIHRWGLEVSRFDWPSWKHFEDFCAAQIPKVIGQPETVTRFQGGPVFQDDTFQDVMDAVCLLSCSEWQDYDGKIFFVTPEDRLHIHEFVDDEDGVNEPGTGNIVAGSLQMGQVDEKQLVNKLTLRFRNLEHPERKEADIIVERRELRQLYGDVEDEIYLGPCTAHQAKRVGEYELARKTDYPVRGELRGMGDSDHVIPGDFVLVKSHRFNWLNGEKMFIVVDKDEESDGSADAARYSLEERVNGMYRDDVTAPLPPSTDDPSIPNPYAAPPLVLLVDLNVVHRVTPTGGWIADVEGRVTFDVFPGQRGIVWMRTASTPYVPVAEITPRPNGIGYFQVSGLGSPTEDIEYFFKVVSESRGRSSLPLADADEYSTVVESPNAPGAATNLQLQPLGAFALDGAFKSRIGVSFDFPVSVYALTARIEYRLVGDAEWIDAGAVVLPNELNKGYYEINDVSKGTWEVRVIVETSFLSSDVNLAPTDEVTLSVPPQLPAPINGSLVRDAHNNWHGIFDPGVRAENVLSIGEEIKRYRVRIHKGGFSGPVARQFDIETAQGISMYWAFHNIGFPCSNVASTDKEGSILHPGHATDQGCIYWSQVLYGDGDIFFEASDKLTPRSFHIINEDVGHTTTQIYWETTYAGQIPQIRAQFSGPSFWPLAGMRFGIRIRRQQASFIGPNGQEIFRSEKLPLSGAYRIQISFGLLDGQAQEAKRVTFYPVEREFFLYTEAMQLNPADFGSVQNTLYAEIRELSNNPGAPEGLPLYLLGTI